MSGTLYDEDIVAWSEQQAAALRSLAANPSRLPNELDMEHLIEEIEDVGQSQRNAVESYARQIFVHLLKLAALPGSSSARHWRAEIVSFHNDLLAKVTPSMRNRIDLDKTWERALDEAQARIDAMDPLPDDTTDLLIPSTSAGRPLDFDTLSAGRLNIDAVLSRWPQRNRL